MINKTCFTRLFYYYFTHARKCSYKGHLPTRNLKNASPPLLLSQAVALLLNPDQFFLTNTTLLIIPDENHFYQNHSLEEAVP